MSNPGNPPPQQAPTSPQEHSARLIASGKPLRERPPNQDMSRDESMQTWGTSKLYSFIQRAVQQAEGIHNDL